MGRRLGSATWLVSGMGWGIVWEMVWERSPDRDPKIAPTGRHRDPEIVPTVRVLLPAAALALAVLVAPVFAAESVAVRAPDPLFASDEVLRVTLRGPLDTLAKDKADDSVDRPGTLSYTEADGRQISLDIGLKTRGHSRRREGVCSFPPLGVDLPKKKTLDGTLFEHQTKLKLVTFCRPTDRHQQFLLKEYLAYKLFNHLTDASFRVRLLQVDYVDADQADETVTRWGFFIEEKKRLGKRLGLPVREPDKIERTQLEPVQASRIEAFNYLLGNTDFSLVAAAPGRTCCHNIVLYEQPDGRFLTVPYDFDMTGLVEPPYQMPSRGLGISNVRQRLFRGYCREGDYTRKAVAELVAEKESLLGIIGADPRLDSRTRGRAIAYLESGYEIFADPDQLQRRVLGACR